VLSAIFAVGTPFANNKRKSIKNHTALMVKAGVKNHGYYRKRTWFERQEVL
jgi:hypothetical protein